MLLLVGVDRVLRQRQIAGDVDDVDASPGSWASRGSPAPPTGSARRSSSTRRRPPAPARRAARNGACAALILFDLFISSSPRAIELRSPVPRCVDPTRHRRCARRRGDSRDPAGSRSAVIRHARTGARATRLRRRGPRRASSPGGVVHAALEFAHDAGDVPVHRGPRRVGIARRDRREDRRVVADRLPRERFGVEMLLHPPPELGALVPQPLDDELERAVAGGLGDAEVEVAVGLLADRRNRRRAPPSARPPAAGRRGRRAWRWRRRAPRFRLRPACAR